MIQASYVGEGLKGLLKELEIFYYAFADCDVVGIADMPDNTSSVAFSMMINASGAVNAKTTVLLTPEEIDQATKKTVDYRAPGQ